MILKAIQYIKSRLNEHSTWVGLSLAVSAAAVLPYPWNIFSFLIGAVGSLVPDGKVSDDQ